MLKIQKKSKFEILTYLEMLYINFLFSFFSVRKLAERYLAEVQANLGAHLHQIHVQGEPAKLQHLQEALRLTDAEPRLLSGLKPKRQA